MLPHEKPQADGRHRVTRGRIDVWCAALLISLCGLVSSAAAAEVKLECIPRIADGTRICEIQFKGPIVRGDADKLLGIVKGHSDYLRYLALDSLGGDVQEAMRLADVVRTALLMTTNRRSIENGTFKPLDFEDQDACVSACALVWLAGSHRTLYFGIRRKQSLGLHRPYFAPERYATESPTELARKQAEIMSRMREVMVSEGMPTHVVDAMMNRSSREVYWLTPTDYEAVGERPAWFQEVLIAKCGLNPELKRALKSATLATPEATVRDLASKHSANESQVVQCSANLRGDAQAQMRSTSRESAKR